MRPQDIVAVLHQRPFQSLRLILTTGIVHEVRHPEMVMVGRSTLVIEQPAIAEPLAGQVTIVALVHIVQIEQQPLTASSANN